MRKLAILAGASACLLGCAAVAEKSGELFSSNAPAIGVLDGRILWGQANFTSAREATVQLQSTDAPVLTCSGTLRYTASSSGMLGLACNDGRSVSSAFQSLSPLSGASRSQAGAPGFAFTYGLPPEKAAGYLALPVERLLRPAGS